MDMTTLLVLLLILVLYLAALKWLPRARISADQDRVDHELDAMRSRIPR